uniref:DNA-directed RNA polymerase III subunit RPC3 n=1 Tax=Angiostrongylus cantonensis TaxID=6313 RepID=A0A0K0CW12_ANGCA
MDSGMRIIYSVDKAAVLAFSKVPRCCLIVKTLYGGLAEAICEELFSNVVPTHFQTGTHKRGDHVKDKFCRLSESHFIARCPPVVSSLKGCPQFERNYDPYIMPDVILQASSKTADRSRKRKAQSLDGDEGIYWRINWQRFDSYIRDEVTLELLVPKASHLVTQTIRSLLKANEIRTSPVATINSAPISLFDIMRAVKENELGIEKSDLEKTLKILAEESHGVVRKSGESGGGLYIIDFEAAIEQICQYHIESLIREQLEYRAVRIFRLLQQKGYLEEDQIEKLTMMSGKETRELLYAMLEEGYVFTKPIGRTNDFAPARTFVLYHVDLPQTVRSLIEYTCKMLRNIVLRRAFEAKEHRQLIEQMYLSAADRLALEKYRRAQTVLNAAETECERGLFAFRLFIEFSRRKC